LLSVLLAGLTNAAGFGKIVRDFCKILFRCFLSLLSALFSEDTKQVLMGNFCQLTDTRKYFILKLVMNECTLSCVPMKSLVLITLDFSFVCLQLRYSGCNPDFLCYCYYTNFCIICFTWQICKLPMPAQLFL